MLELIYIYIYIIPFHTTPRDPPAGGDKLPRNLYLPEMGGGVQIYIVGLTCRVSLYQGVSHFLSLQGIIVHTGGGRGGAGRN
jgi:hypothetical protein